MLKEENLKKPEFQAIVSDQGYDYLKWDWNGCPICQEGNDKLEVGTTAACQCGVQCLTCGLSMKSGWSETTPSFVIVPEIPKNRAGKDIVFYKADLYTLARIYKAWCARKGTK